MFWLFSLVSHALIITQLPSIFTILLLTFVATSFASLSIANYLIDKRWLLSKLLKACLLASILSFMLISGVVYGLQQAEIYHWHLAYKPILAFVIMSLPLAICLVSLKYYLEHRWPKLLLILAISLLNNIAQILLIGHAAKWATDHGYYASRLFL